MEELDQIKSRIDFLKREISAVYLYELKMRRYDYEQVDIIIGHFEKIVRRNYFIFIETDEDLSIEENMRLRKISNIFKFIENGDWSDSTMLKLIDAMFIRIFKTTHALIIFSRNLRELRVLSKKLYTLQFQ